MDRWALVTVLWGGQTLSSRTGPGRSVCSWEANMCVEAHWCRRDGLPLLLTALLGLYFSVCSILLIIKEYFAWILLMSTNSHFFLCLVFWPCSSKKELSRWRVVSGRTYMSTLGGSYVDRIVLNGNYDPKRNDYDIALMRLSSPISVGGQRVLSQKHTNRNLFFFWLVYFSSCPVNDLSELNWRGVSHLPHWVKFSPLRGLFCTP